MLVIACGHFNRVGITVAGDERIIPYLGVSEKSMGAVYTAFLIFYTAAMLPGGWFIDRFGPRLAIVLLGLGSTLFVALSGCVGLIFHSGTPLLIGLLIVRSLLGIMYAPLHPGSARMLADELPPRAAARANGWTNFSACVGIASTQLVLGPLIDRFDWPGALLISSAMTLVVALVWTISTRSMPTAAVARTSQASAAIDIHELARVLRHRSVIGITASYAAYGYFQYLFFYWIKYYFVEIQHQEKTAARGYYTAITLAMGAGMLCGGWLTSHVPARFSPWARRALVPVVGMFASGAVFELGLLVKNPQATVAAFVVSAALLGLCEAAFWTTAIELGGRFGGTAAGLMNTGGNAGGAISPYLTPFMSSLIAGHYGDDLGWRLSLSVAGFIVFAGGALWWTVRPK